MGNNAVHTPPNGLAILALVGPSFIWCAEYIGSGEVILATRTGAILGTSVIWAIIAGVFLKYWIGMSGARYTVCTGEGMIDMCSRMPGPKYWAVWTILIGQLFTAAISIGSIASAAGVFINSMVKITPYFGGWIVTIFAVIIVWSGKFEALKIIMSFFVLIIIIGVFYVAFSVFPDLNLFLSGLIPTVKEVPDWAVVQGVNRNAWREILPLLGWGAGGFASQVWYTYWVLGAGYGVARGRPYGQAADTVFIKNMKTHDASKVKGWCRVVYTDATLAMGIGTAVTVSFLIAGAGVLGSKQLAPEGTSVALTLSTLFSEQWGRLGGFLFILGGAVALIATQVGQLAGWPRLLADAFRICIPGFNKRLSWRRQFRMFLLFFLFTNMIIVFTFGLKPVFLVKIGAILDGLLLTPLQALWVGIGLYFVLPKLYNQESYHVIRPHWIFAVGLIIAFFVFGYFCIFQIPYVF
jgi:Mn2+/Fe2+ NRAMP family transporter